mgnify:CR=1 FL=1
MKASKEHKRWFKILVKHYGKKNGSVKGCFFDNPEMERKAATDKKLRLKKDKTWQYEHD